jgi:dGTPase
VSECIEVKDLITDGLVIARVSDPEHVKRKNSDSFKENKSDTRDDFERDYARVLHSASFRRLQGKMQLLGTQVSDFYRTRLTHSLEVSQIGSEIASKITVSGERNVVSKSLVMMACLAHDIGNPPFGHFGEKALNVIMKDMGGFEGNAQTLRVLSSLEKKSKAFDGLNLTLAAKMSVVKYNVQPPEGDTILKGKFLYHDQYDELQESMLPAQTIECQIMELADDIAYACHDLEDGLKSGIIHLEDIESHLSGCQGGEKLLETFNGKVTSAATLSGVRSGDMFYKALTSVLINTFIQDIEVCPLTDKERKKKGTLRTKALGLRTQSAFLEGLKSGVLSTLIGKPAVAEYEIQGASVIKSLYDMLTDKTYNYRDRFFPEEYRYFISNDIYPLERVAVDYIAGMTDAFALRLYAQHFGKDVPKYQDNRWTAPLP